MVSLEPSNGEPGASSFTVSFSGPHEDFLNTVVAPALVKGVAESDLILYVDNDECSGGPPSLSMSLEDESQGFHLSVIANTDSWSACVDLSGRPFLDGWGFLTDRRFPQDVGNTRGPVRDIQVESMTVATRPGTWGALKSRFDGADMHRDGVDADSALIRERGQFQRGSRSVTQRFEMAPRMGS